RCRDGETRRAVDRNDSRERCLPPSCRPAGARRGRTGELTMDPRITRLLAAATALTALGAAVAGAQDTTKARPRSSRSIPIKKEAGGQHPPPPHHTTTPHPPQTP